MKSLRVKYFAILREAAGKSVETLTTPAETAAELYAELQTRYGFKLDLKNIRMAANTQFQPLEYKLQEGDEIVFIPPVAGG